MIWKPLKDFDDVFEISEYGHIRRYGCACISFKKTSDGYYYAGLRYKGKRYWRRKGRLVGLTFVENPYSKPFINHKDLNKENDHYLNLEWSTVAENTQHAYDNGVKMGTQIYNPSLGNIGVLSPSSKKIVQVDLNGNKIKEWGSRADAQRAGFSSAIKYALKDDTKTSGGFKWQYA